MKLPTLLAAMALLYAPNPPLYAQTAPSQEPPVAASVATQLGLSRRQIERLNTIYDKFAIIRLEQESRIADWQAQLKQAQAIDSFDERQTDRLTRDIAGAEQKITSAFVKARADALKTLMPEQRADLETLAAQRKTVRDDAYRQLLLLTVEDFWRVPVDAETVRRLSELRSYTVPRAYDYRSTGYVGGLGRSYGSMGGYYGYSVYGARPYGYGTYGYGTYGARPYSYSPYGYGYGGYSTHGYGTYGYGSRYNAGIHSNGYSGISLHFGGGHSGFGGHRGGGHR